MKIYAFTKYGLQGASSRVRFFNYLPYLSVDHDVNYSCLFTDEYVSELYDTGKKNLFKTFFCYAKRFFLFMGLLIRRDVDIVWIEKELFPYIPFPLELILLIFGKKVILDFDDAVFHNYDKLLFSKLYNLKFKMLSRFSSHLMVGNEYLKTMLFQRDNITIVPTVIDKDKYNIRPEREHNIGSMKVCWIGTPNTQKYLSLVDRAIVNLQNKYDIELVLIGANENLLQLECKHIVVPWSNDKEAALISTCDIGIMPVYDNKFEMGKCGFKIIQYLALGLPVIASPVGVNIELCRGCGYCALDIDEWEKYLEVFILSPKTRVEFGDFGRDKVLNRYTYDCQYKVINSILKHIYND